MCLSHFLGVPDIWWRDGSRGKEKRDLLLGLMAVSGGLGAAVCFSSAGLTLVGRRAPQQHPQLPFPRQIMVHRQNRHNTGESL